MIKDREVNYEILETLSNDGQDLKEVSHIEILLFNSNCFPYLDVWR